VVGSRRRLFKLLVIVCLVAGTAYLSRMVWLPLPACLLVRAEEPQAAEIAVVLAGDFYGHRILTAADLARRGYVKRVLVSGPAGAYGHYESALAIDFAVRHGYPAALFFPRPNLPLSTREDARLVVDELRRMGVHKFLVVTSNYHTRRAGSVYRTLARGLEFHVVAAPDEHFRCRDWWRSREASKLLLLEWTKTIAGWIGL